MHRHPTRPLAFIIVFMFATMHASAESRLILVLHSNHQGYEWTNAVNQGISSVFADEPGYELAYEYLDAQRAPAASLGAVAQLFTERYANRQPAVILAVDDDALRFLIQRRDALFPGVPVAFCGINDLTAYDASSLSAMTGVTESPDIAGSLELAFRLFPSTKTVFALSDTTTAGMLNRTRLERIAATLPAGVRVVQSTGQEPGQLASELGALSADTIVLYLSYLRTNAGERLTVTESVSFVAGASPVPVFGCWDFIVAAGAFGGRVVSGRLQGLGAAERALAIARGQAAESLPIGAQAYESVVHYDQLKRFSIKNARLPHDIVVLDPPVRLPKIYIIGISALGLIIALEAMTIVIALRGRKMLVVAESRYRTLAEQLPAIVYSVELGKDSRTTYVSPRLKEMLGYEPEAWMNNPREWLQAVHPDDRERLIAEAKVASEAGTPVTFFYRSVSASGQIEYVKNSRSYYMEKNGRQAAIGVWMNVTEERKAQEAMKAALAEKELLLKEIHHRVKNNFQIVTSLLRLECERIPQGPVADALNETERRIFAMALVHERLYQQGDLGKIDFRPYAERMGQELVSINSTGTDTAFSVKGDELSLGVDRAVPLGLFLNEALMNAFKHAFPPGFSGDRSIHVVTRSLPDADQLTVHDSGIGFDPGRCLHPVQPGSSSLGLTLMMLLADQLGGSMTIRNEQGALITLTFKKQESGPPPV